MSLSKFQPQVPDHILIEEYRFLRGQGQLDERIARQLGFDRVDTLHSALRRLGLKSDGETS